MYLLRAFETGFGIRDSRLEMDRKKAEAVRIWHFRYRVEFEKFVCFELGIAFEDRLRLCLCAPSVTRLVRPLEDQRIDGSAADQLLGQG